MKNLHIIATDKPSRLYFNNNDKCFQLCKVSKKSTPLKINQNIYITNSEEIKEGEPVIHNFGMGYELENPCDSDNLKSNTRFKIILTTDQDLIKDGVQAIDDEFLEWFVNNPSCEFVGTELVEFEVDMGLGESCIEYGGYYKITIPKEEPLYDYGWCKGNVILPKEEPKQSTKERIISETSEETKQKARDYGNSLVNKKETLEEIFDIIDDEKCRYSTEESEFWKHYKIGVLDGLKWQQERMYSEEEVIKLLHKRDEHMNTYDKLHGGFQTPKEWFKQFKKK
jgi:hypothetical protein